MAEEKERRITISLRISPQKTKDLKRFCLEHDITVRDFLENAAWYCMAKKILPSK